MTRQSSKQTNPWPILVIAIGLAFVGVTAWSIIQAMEKVSPITDPAYYSHGLRYNQTTLERQAAESSGWSVHTELAGRVLKITLADSASQAVSGCLGVLLLFDTGDSSPSRRLALPVREGERGVYLAEMPENVMGIVTADLSLHRDGSRFNRRLLISL